MNPTRISDASKPRDVAPGFVLSCVICKERPRRTKRAQFCEECVTGSCPAKIERLVRKAERTGALKPIREHSCVDCGAPARHYDHRDYNKPLEVEPVCASCNYYRGPAIRYDWERDVLNLLEPNPRKGI